MGHCHEFGQCRSAQYGMIRRFEVGNFEFDELGAVVFPRAKGDWKDHRAKWMRCIAWDDAVERGLSWDKHVSLVQAHLSQSAGEDEVETTSAVDENSGELDFCHHRVQDQGEFAGL
jgi:hypothetical protein